MKKLLCLLLLVCAGPWSAAANQGDNAALAAIQAQGDVLRGRFTQEKHLAELDQPLVSRGQYVIARDHGLIWRVQEPLQATLIISQQQLVQRSDGEQTLRISADQQPGLSVVTAILLAIFQADIERLKTFFHLHSESLAQGGWAIELTPRQASVGEFIESVRIQGGQSIERIDIRETGGDRSRIQLQQTEAGAGGLTASEQAEFAD